MEPQLCLDCKIVTIIIVIMTTTTTLVYSVGEKRISLSSRLGLHHTNSKKVVAIAITHHTHVKDTEYTIKHENHTGPGRSHSDEYIEAHS